jgi:hypothetical protein
MAGITYLQKWLSICVFALLISSCKTGKTAIDGNIDDNLTAKAIIRNHYKNRLDFKTLSGRMKVDYSDGESSQSVGVSLRMEKDQAIWMSAPLGVVKAYITPTRVSFYNKLQNEYFDGDFSYLSNLLGTELDFDKVQNLLLGQSIFALRKDKYQSSVNGNSYELKPITAMDLFKVMFRIQPGNFKMATQQLSQPLKKRLLEINYKNYQQTESGIIPDNVAIIAIQDDERTVITIEYRNIEFNRPLNFPYKIPEGFNEIVLK